MKLAAIQPFTATPARSSSAADELSELPPPSIGEEPVAETQASKNDGEGDRREGVLRLLEEAERRRRKRELQRQHLARGLSPDRERALRAYGSFDDFADSQDLAGANLKKVA
jgi:hypothetical protein